MNRNHDKFSGFFGFFVLFEIKSMFLSEAIYSSSFSSFVIQKLPEKRIHDSFSSFSSFRVFSELKNYDYVRNKKHIVFVISSPCPSQPVRQHRRCGECRYPSGAQQGACRRANSIRCDGSSYPTGHHGCLPGRSVQDNTLQPR